MEDKEIVRIDIDDLFGKDSGISVTPVKKNDVIKKERVDGDEKEGV